MCRICQAVATDSEYARKMEEWVQRDAARLENSRKKAPSNEEIRSSLFTNIGFPPRINYPLFEARFGLSVPMNFYQNIFVDGKRLVNNWAHDYCRGISFAPNGDLILLTKAVGRKLAEEWLLFYYLVKFSKANNEFSYRYNPANGFVELSVRNVKVKGTNLADKSPAEHEFTFNFFNKATERMIVKKERLQSDAIMRQVYGRGPQKTLELAKTDFEEYVVTEPHFAPHPYMLYDYKLYGFNSRMEFQNSVKEYFSHQK